jgi:LmbE family N-acetylglucosaminyl deacetylase/O-antigen/teichoic acid export membrane protein
VAGGIAVDEGERPGRVRRPARGDVSGLERDGLALLAGTTLVGLANYGFVLALVWILPARQFSELASINAILLVLIMVANAALPWVVTRSVVRSAPRSPVRIQAVTVTLGVALVCAVLGFIVLLALSSSYATPGVEVTAGLIVVLAFAGQAGSGYLQGRRLFLLLGVLMVLEAVIKVGAGVLLAVVAGATGALAGAAAGIGVLAGVSLWLARRDMGRSGRPLWSYPWAQITGIGAVQAGVSGLAMLDVIVGSLLHGASHVMAGYQAMLVFTRVPLFLTGALSAALYSRLAGGPGPQSRDWVVGRAAATYRSLVAPLVAAACTAPAVLVLLVVPAQYRSSLHMLVPLAIAGAASGWINLVTTCYQAESSFRLPGTVVWLSLPIAAALELVVGTSVTDLAWAAAAVNSSVALILILAAGHRYRQARLFRQAGGAIAVAGTAAVFLAVAARVPGLWCVLVALVAAGSWVWGRDRDSRRGGTRVVGAGALLRLPAQAVRRSLLKVWTLLVVRVRPIAPPGAWRALVAVRSLAGTGPVVCLPSAVRALVVAPHPDDETIGCGGTVALMSDSGCSVDVVVVSRGDASVAEPGALRVRTGERRLAELAAAAGQLGATTLSSLDLPDGDLLSALEPLTEGLRLVLADSRPQIIFAPWPLDDHPDHRATSLAVAAALRSSGLESTTEVWTYEVWAALPANRLVDVTSVWPQKEAALNEHRCGRVTFDLDAHLALARWRSIFAMNGNGYAEAFLALRSSDFCQLIGSLDG